MIDVSIIVVSYNTREMTLASLKSVYEQTNDICFEIIVVDNNSSDNSAKEISENFSEIQLLKSSINLGFAVANNLAAEKAKGEYLLFLNPDTLVLNGAVQNLYNFAKNNPSNRVYGGRTLFQDYTLNSSSCWRRMTNWSIFCYATGLASIFRRNAFFNPESYGQWERDTIREVDIVSGCFLLIERKLWEKLKGFDTRFFIYGEDSDLCLRSIGAGAKPVITPSATIIHYCGASEKVRTDKLVKLFRAKNQLISLHWNKRSAKIGFFLLKYSVFSRMCIYYLLKSWPISGKILFQNGESWQELWLRRNEWLVPKSAK